MAKLAEQLLELAIKAGASEAEVYQWDSRSHPVFFEANRLKQLESEQSSKIALRLWREGCPGLAVGCGEVEPNTLVERAIAISHLNSPETIEIAQAQDLAFTKVGEIVPTEELVAIGKEAIAQLHNAHPQLLCSAELECEQETTRLINSRGLDCQCNDTSLSASVAAEWMRGEDFLEIYKDQQARDSLDLAALVKPISQLLHWATEKAPPPSGRVPIIFTAKAATLLWDTVSEALNGKHVLEGSSPWSNRLGERVLAPLTLSQQPELGPFSCPFDDEGTPTQPLSLITQGHLQQFYSDRTTSRALGDHTTGNGFRPSLGCYPIPELVNLLVEPGEGTLTELIAQLDEGLVVDQILGDEANLSGDFSINVELGYRVQKGKIVGRVKDTMVAGNIYTALQQLLALGSDNEWNGACYTPSLIVEGLSVVG